MNDLVDAIAKTIWLAEFERAFSRKPSDPWENQADSSKEGHRNTARKIIEAGFVIPDDGDAPASFRRIYDEMQRGKVSADERTKS